MSGSWLAELAPAHAPPGPGWWPPAPGWWAAAVLCAGLIVLGYLAVRWWGQPGRRCGRAALRELRVIRASSMDGPSAARAIENLLRRYALALYGRETVARLTGRAWLQFASAAGAEQLAGEAGRSLLASAFGERTTADRESWLAAAAEFIERAARAPGPSSAPVPSGARGPSGAQGLSGSQSPSSAQGPSAHGRAGPERSR